LQVLARPSQLGLPPGRCPPAARERRERRRIARLSRRHNTLPAQVAFRAKPWSPPKLARTIRPHITCSEPDFRLILRKHDLMRTPRKVRDNPMKRHRYLPCCARRTACFPWKLTKTGYEQAEQGRRRVRAGLPAQPPSQADADNFSVWRLGPRTPRLSGPFCAELSARRT
jgi:hypothetical protein